MNQEPKTLQTQAVYLEGELVRRIQELHGKVAFWRQRAFAARILTAVLGALITAIAGWKGGAPFQEICKFLSAILGGKDNWILLLGAFVTIINVWTAFFNHRDSWVTNAAATDRLRALLATLQFRSKGPAFDDAALNKVFEEYCAVLNDTNQRWTEIRRAPAKDSNLTAPGS